MTAKDQRIIKEFPEATPYDLLNTHGLSMKGYNELCSNNDTAASLQAFANRPKVTVVNTTPARVMSGQIKVKNLENGNISTFAAKYGYQLEKQHPTKFKVMQ